MASLYKTIAEEMLAPNREAARALPDNQGGETPKQLQTSGVSFHPFTVPPGTTDIFTSEMWSNIRVTMTTPGPAWISPGGGASSGTSIPLVQGVPFDLTVPRATRVFVKASATSFISLVVQPIPWMEQLSNEIKGVGHRVLRGSLGIVRALLNAPKELEMPQQEPPPSPRNPRRALAPLAPLAPLNRRG